MKSFLLIFTFAFGGLLSYASPIKSALGAYRISDDGEESPYDSLVEYIGFSVISAGDAKSMNISISDIQWDSFSISLYVPSTSLVGIRSGPGGKYIYLGSNRIAFNPDTYRGGYAFMGIQDGVPVITDRFVEYISPSPTRLYWKIDGTEYSVAACRNTGGDFGVLNEPYTTGGTLGYYVAWCKLYYKGECTLDLVPVRFTNEDGKREGGMIDLISGVLYRKNSGTGEFEIGPDL